MIESINREELWERYQGLKPDLQEAIFSESSAETINNIAVKNSIFHEKVGLLGRLTGRVLLGLLSPNKFISAITENIEIDKETASAVAQDINRQIFFPVRDSLRELYGLSAASAPSEPTMPTGQTMTTEQKPTVIESKENFKPQTIEEPISSQTEKVSPPSPLRISSEEFPSPPLNNDAKHAPNENKPEKQNLNPKPFTPNTADKYREPIAQEDTENLPPPPAKAPEGAKLDGNIIDLKDIKIE